MIFSIHYSVSTSPSQTWSFPPSSSPSAVGASDHGLGRRPMAKAPDTRRGHLNDLFYHSQPEEVPWIRTECVIDVVQAAAYLGQAVVFLYKAWTTPGCTAVHGLGPKGRPLRGTVMA